jgi:hypothetical protein
MTDELVRRFLGPERRPLSCEQCFVDRYVEWKLAEPDEPFETCAICESEDCVDASECLAMSAHLESCPACEEEYATLRDLVLSERSS